MRRACIDIGSNTTRLLVADSGDATELVARHQERAFTRIGGSLDRDGAIPLAKIEEVADVVAAQLASAQRLGAEDVICVATAAVRRATNGERLVALVAARCRGLDVRVLSGKEEARAAFAGAVWGMGAAVADRVVAVVDVGGGSTELAVGLAPDRIQWSVSLPLGSGDLGGAGRHSDPPSAAELAEARRRAREEIGRARPPAVAQAVAVGGSANSLRALAGDHLDAAAFERALGLIAGVRAAELARRSGLDIERVRLLPAGLLILEAVSELLGRTLEVGHAGLREGLLLTASV